jgi:hypothetical protein
MKEWYPPKVRKAVEALLNRPAVCTPFLRRAVEAHAARLSGGTRDLLEVPADLLAYVEKVTQSAYKITDQDIERLRKNGYSEDAIFEITLCASMGAGLARLERGLTALKGGQHAPANS